MIKKTVKLFLLVLLFGLILSIGVQKSQADFCDIPDATTTPPICPNP